MSSGRNVAGDWLSACRVEERYDHVHGRGYGERWGAITPTHRRLLDELLDRTPPDGLVLNAACGTGKYWQRILAPAGR